MSPRIRRLAADLEHSNRVAVMNEFWREMEKNGAPIVEPDPDDPNYRQVTFVWRDRDGSTENVVVLWGPAPYWDVPSNTFERLTGTDVWYRTYRVRSDMRGRYILSPNDPLTPLAKEGTPEARERYGRFIPDPLNPEVLRVPRNPSDPLSIERRFSILELPDAPPQPWAGPRNSEPRELPEHRVTSRILGNDRPVWVHTPVDYDPDGPPLPLLVILDGRAWIEQLSVVPTLDNLRADDRIPPMVTVLVDSLDWQTRSRELTCHEPFLEFLGTELMPWIHARWPIVDDPERRILDGLSYGGLTALLAGLRIPDVFGNVIAHSPSLWWGPSTSSDEGAEWLTRQYAVTPRQPVRAYVEMGLNEGPAMIPTARHLRNVMEAKEYDMTYVEYNGGHDLNCWRGGQAEALRVLAGSWGGVHA